MLINYWDCDYEEYDEYLTCDSNGDVIDEVRAYICTYPDNKERFCCLNNKYCDEVENCTLLDNI
ncbi:MAG: hypothetical protein GY861_22215 [bacterium]|nr:hypothetical protein [bacterium]